MFSFLISYIKSLFTPTDITVTLNGSQLTFTKEGDIKLEASRNLITNGKYIFQNCTEVEINKVLNPIIINESKLPSCSHSDIEVVNAFYFDKIYFGEK